MIIFKQQFVRLLLNLSFFVVVICCFITFVFGGTAFVFYIYFYLCTICIFIKLILLFMLQYCIGSRSTFLKRNGAKNECYLLIIFAERYTKTHFLPWQVTAEGWPIKCNPLPLCSWICIKKKTFVIKLFCMTKHSALVLFLFQLCTAARHPIKHIKLEINTTSHKETLVDQVSRCKSALVLL